MTATLLYDRLAQLLDRLQPLLLLAARVYVSIPFFRSGLLKVEDWGSTLFLFQEEYRVPLLSPAAAAVAGAAGELVFPVLLVLGIGTRLAAIGLSAVNVMAVVAYAHVLLQPGFESALGQHQLWGALLVAIAVFGPGPWSLDRWLFRTDVSSLRSTTG